jgi:hypothetical protein
VELGDGGMGEECRVIVPWPAVSSRSFGEIAMADGYDLVLGIAVLLVNTMCTSVV